MTGGSAARTAGILSRASQLSQLEDRQKALAGPPMRKELCALIGSFSSMRPSGSALRSSRTRLSLKGT